MANESKHSRVCPNCGNKLSFSSNQSTVNCPCCDTDYSVSELLALNQTGTLVSSPAFAQENIDTNESGLAYLDSVFNVLDWDDFCINSPELFVDSVVAVVEKMKVKYANSPTTWYFEFKSISIPLLKRFSFMDKTLSEIGLSDMDLEDEGLMSKFDCYSMSVDLLAKEKEIVKKRLNFDLEMMSKFKIESRSLKECQEEARDLLERLDGLKATDSIFDLEIVKQKTKSRDDEIVYMYQKQGINAEERYQSALKNYMFGNKTEALRLFESIFEYRDSREYVTKLKQIAFTFANKFVEFAGVNYLFGPSTPDKEPEEQQQTKRGLFRKPQQSVTQTFVSPQKLFEFRPIVDGLKADEPVLKKISRIIMAYGDSLFYIDDTNSLMTYDFCQKIATKLMDLKNCDISSKTLILYPGLGKFVFLSPMEKKSSPLQGGCSFKKKAQPVEEEGPSIAAFRLAIVNCETRTVSYFGENILSITDHFEDKIFFTKAVFKKRNVIEKREYYVYDIRTNKAISPFNREVFIYNTLGKYIIYGLWLPNAYNVDIYSYDMETEEIVLLEKNAYDIAKIRDRYGYEKPLTYDGYIYYTVGNNKYNPLYRVRPDGTDKKEIMPNVENILFMRNGYFYIIKNLPVFSNGQWYYDRYLIKSKADGTSRTIICSDFKNIIDFKQGYIYYIDAYDGLHMVRADGQKDRIIATDCDGVLLINDKHVFFVYKERVSKTSAGKSLYVMDLQGRNRHKLAFDIKEFVRKARDENNIYYSVNDVLSYKVRTPKNDKEYNEPVVNNYKVKVYYGLNVNDFHLTRIYVEGVPQFDKGHEPQGCKLFNKKVLPTLAEQIEHIYPMPEKTKISFIDEGNPQTQSSSSSSAPASSMSNTGCSPKR